MAFDILLAKNLFQIRLYNLYKSRLIKSFISKGFILISVGRIASWASCILEEELLLNSSFFKYSFPLCVSIYSFAILIASSLILVESVRKYVISATVPIPFISTPSYNCCANRMVFWVEKFRILLASCCNVEVVKGSGAFFILSDCLISSTIYFALSSSFMTLSTSALLSKLILVFLP